MSTKSTFLLIFSTLLFFCVELDASKSIHSFISEVTDHKEFNDSIILSKAIELSQHYQYDKAVILLEDVTTRDSLNIDAIKALENLYFKQNKIKSAIRLQDYLIKSKSDTIYYGIRKGLCFKKNGQYKLSLNILSKAYLNDTTNSFVLNQIGDLYKSLNKPDSAIIYYTKANNVNSNSSTLIKAMDLHIKNKEPQKALDFFADYYKDDFSENKLLHRLKGKALYLADKIDSSYHTFDKLYSSGDSTLVTTKFLGMCCWKLENYAKGISPLEKFTSIDSTDFQVYYMLGCCYIKDEFIYNPKKGLAALNKSIELLQADGQTLNLVYKEIALNYQRTQQYNKELEVYFKMKENEPDSKYVDYMLATLYDYGLKNKKEALNRYQQLLSYYEADTATQRTKSDIELFCKNRIAELKEEQFWSSDEL